MLHNVVHLITELITSYTIRTVALGAAVLGLVSGMLGCYAVLRRQSLLGDAISHAALPGIVAAFLITGVRELSVLLVGATIAGWVAALVMITIVQYTHLHEDSTLGIVLSVFFGFGLVLLSFAQKIPTASQAGLGTFLFGQSAALIERDVVTMALIGGVALTLMLLLWKELKILSFDPDYGATIGFPIRILDVCLTSLIVVAIVIGLQTVGVVLMSAMLIAPAAAARQWTDCLGVMVLLAGIFGMFSGIIGAVVSATARGLSTGPTIVLVMSSIVILSFVFAPQRGLLWQWRHTYQKGTIQPYDNAN